MFKNFFESLKKRKLEKEEAATQIAHFKKSFESYVANDFNEESYQQLTLAKPTYGEMTLKDKSDLLTKMLEKIYCDGYISDSELIHIEKAMHIMDLKREDVPDFIKLVDFARKLGLIREGRYRSTSNHNVILKGNEYVIVESEASLAETVTTRHYQSGSAGVSMRIAKGLTIHQGGTRGHSVSVKTEQATSDGTLTITNNRIVFTSPKKAFNVNINKLLNYSIDDDNRIAFLVENRKTPNVVYVNAYDKLLIEAALTYILKNNE